MSNGAAMSGQDARTTEMAPDGTYAGLRPQNRILGLSQHWWVWISVIYLNVMDGAVGEVWKLAAGLMQKDLGWSATQISAVRGHGQWIQAGMDILVTYVYRRWLINTRLGVMYMFLAQILGEVLWGVFALMLAPHRYWVLFAMEIPYRFLVAWGGIAQYVVIVNWFETRRGLALGITGTAGEGGTPVLWGALGGVLVPRIGYRLTWFIAGMGLLPAAILQLLFVRNWPSQAGLLPWGADPARAHMYTAEARSEQRKLGNLEGIPPAQRWGFNLREALKHPGYWVFMVAIFVSPLIWYFGAYGIAFHARAVGVTTEQMGLAITFYGIWYIIQGVALGHTFDWRGWDYRYAIAWGPIGGIALAQGILAYTRSVAGFMVGYMCVAMGIAAWVPMITAAFVDTYGPLALGLVYGVAGRATTSAGIAVAFYLIGWTATRYGSLYPAYKINWMIGILMMLLFVFALRPTLKLYRSLRNPPPWAFAKNAEAVRRNPRKVAPVY